ncbi:WD40-repeat-containing domain protein [Leucosporidium creatinivorum]|uniref:WD40-repeat-containing domain protein n=1 Tax=Leucosporidium creatinivorum TaxID=106004 RepID=A0A1Y2CKP5_9BASI|nr:WD40-repeat-containing domain protein [Leucosporidium creatinivorum]
MKCKVVEIRWHDTTPIFSTDFHASPPLQHKKAAHPYLKTAGGVDVAQDEQRKAGEEEEDKMWRLATCGGDKNVRLWLVHPRPSASSAPLTLPPTPLASSSKLPPPPPPSAAKQADSGGPTVEYLATLKQHTGIVNVVRFSPVGDMLASAGDDGNVLFWVPGESTSNFGESVEDQQYEREKWRVKTMTKTGQEIYDLSFSPDGQRILTGSIDHTANIYDVGSGQLIHTIAEHTNYVQGVSWDPWNRFIATQSSDRSMHIYSIADTASGLQVHAVGKNSRMEVQHTPGGTWRPPTPAQTPSSSFEKADDKDKSLARPRLHQRSHSRASDSGASEASSSISHAHSHSHIPHPPPQGDNSTTAASDDAIIIDEETTPMDPPAAPRPLSRRSSTSGSHPGQSPSLVPRSPQHHPPHLRSPSPAPLPAVKVPLSPTMAPSSGSGGKIETLKLYTDANSTPFFRRLSWSTDGSLLLTPAGLFEDPYAGIGLAAAKEEKDKEASTSSKKRKSSLPVSTKDKESNALSTKAGGKPTVYIYSRSNVARPPVAHLPGHKTTSIAIRFCPVLWDLRMLKSEGVGEESEREPIMVDLTGEGKEVKLPSGEEKGKGKEDDNVKPQSLFDLPYRMVYAVATLDTVFLYDTQQAAPLAMFGNLHYAPFTDLSWTPDGQTLILSAQDGYCSIIAFDPLELGTPYKTALKDLPPPPLPFTTSHSSIPATAPAPATLPTLFKKVESTPAAPSASTSTSTSATGGEANKKREGEAAVEGEQPAKKAKKRAVLIHQGPVQ